MKQKSKILIAIIAVSVSLIGVFFWTKNSIPDVLHIIEGEEEKLTDLSFHSFVTEEILSVDSQSDSNIPEGSIKIQCKLLGVIPIKEVDVQPVEEIMVTPMGMPIGIYMQTNGILVVGTGIVNGVDGLNYEPSLNILQSGDYIIGLNGMTVESKDELVEAVNDSKGKEIEFKVLRNDEVLNVKVTPIQTGEGDYKVGLWVRDDTQGIGTLTYVDEEGGFGALGHGISDVDTNTILSIKEGKMYDAEIISITKGERGAPGELSGVIHYQEENVLGTINSNSDSGIFGTIEKLPDGYEIGEAIPVGLKQEIEEGAAEIICAVDGKLTKFDIVIEKVNLGSTDVNKSMVLHITDPDLLELTGGIVQGMSGSPILQNGKFIGAVTHVFIQDATSGYGIFAENMLRVE